jgi:hypothetical protein
VRDGRRRGVRRLGECFSVGMKRRAPIGVGLAAAFSFTWATTAGAHAGYPLIIDSTLMLSGKSTVEMTRPRMGCRLCHHSASGMDELRDFGNLMVANFGSVWARPARPAPPFLSRSLEPVPSPCSAKGDLPFGARLSRGGGAGHAPDGDGAAGARGSAKGGPG